MFQEVSSKNVVNYLYYLSDNYDVSSDAYFMLFYSFLLVKVVQTYLEQRYFEIFQSSVKTYISSTSGGSSNIQFERLFHF